MMISSLDGVNRPVSQAGYKLQIGNKTQLFDGKQIIPSNIVKPDKQSRFFFRPAAP